MTDQIDDLERELAERPPPASGSRRGQQVSEGPKNGHPKRWPFLLVGLVLGAAAALALPPLVAPYLPEAFRPAGEEVSGVVAGKEREENRLLLTVRAEQGAILATFDRRIAEIDLLVDRGDTVTLGVDRYQPFVENPVLRGVRKVDRPEVGPGDEAEPPEIPAREEAAPPEDGAREAAPPEDGAREETPDEERTPLDEGVPSPP